MTDPRDSMRWLWRGVVLAFLVIGWVFIAWQNHFHVTAPMVFVCLGYLAVVVTVYNLWRTGAATVDASEDEPDSTWARSGGALGELEREKRTLLKAIKEAEFDHEMGKLSQRDADDMIRDYRARAIDVIKEIDRLGLGAAGTVREQILREVRARVQLEGKAPKKAADGKGGKTGKRAERDATVRATPTARNAAAKDAAARDAVAKAAEPGGEGAARRAEAAAASEASAAKANTSEAEAKAEAAADAAPAADGSEAQERAAAPSDDELDADSTTAIEPRHDDPAKEATP